ncbi:unnamed protein product [Amaranthus hypochondriacus]
MVDEMSASKSSQKIPFSDSKMIVGTKRRGEELEEDSGESRKHTRIRDPQSVLHSEGNDTHQLENLKVEETDEHMDIVETQSSQVLDKNTVGNADALQLDGGLVKASTHLVDHSGSMPLDLNLELCTDETSGYNDAVVSLGDYGKHSSCAKGKASLEHNPMSLGGNHLDLNAEEVASSVNHDLHNQNNLKIRDTSDSARTTGQFEGFDGLKKWEEMKKNGFLSYGYGGIPAAPKQRRKKNKNELKQKIELAKKEQVDRFTKIAAPSGLLNGLNPGIINHVRNSKQVQSIIQALVRSEKRESLRQANEIKRGGSCGGTNERFTEQENVDFSGVHGPSVSNVVSSQSSMSKSNLLQENDFSQNSSSLFSAEDRSVCRDLVPKNDVLALKPVSSIKVSGSTSVSNEESANDSSVDTLSVKAATVASQWLHLVHQDIKGRLSALRRSKKRVRDVISTELPFLLSKEFPSNQENSICAAKYSASDYSIRRAAELHESYWSKLFNQMDNTLSEEEKELVLWLNQVNEMMLHCDHGLQHVELNSILEMQHMGTACNTSRSRVNNDPDKELSVRAAAASIYSTCNFLSSKENVSCC